MLCSVQQLCTVIRWLLIATNWAMMWFVVRKKMTWREGLSCWIVNSVAVYLSVVSIIHILCSAFANALSAKSFGLSSDTEWQFWQLLVDEKVHVHCIIMLAVSSGKRNVMVWRPSICPVSILTITHQVATCDAASTYFGLTIRRPTYSLLLQ